MPQQLTGLGCIGRQRFYTSRGSPATIWLWPTGLALAPPTDMGYENKSYETKG